EALRLDAQQVVVSHASNFKPGKRVRDIVESATSVLAAHPNAVYLLIGDGADRAPIEARCRALGLAERVRCLGSIDRADIPAHRRLTDVVVMASDSEGLPLIYLEAQASGRLLVASDIAATRELVTHGATGLVFRAGDIADLAATTRLAIQDPIRRAAIGSAARTAVRSYAKPAVLDAYVALLEEVAGGRAERSAPASADR